MDVSLIAVLEDCSVGVGWVTGRHLVDIKKIQLQQPKRL